jgi:hypothetical protein
MPGVLSECTPNRCKGRAADECERRALVRNRNKRGGPSGSLRLYILRVPKGPLRDWWRGADAGLTTCRVGLVVRAAFKDIGVCANLVLTA